MSNCIRKQKKSSSIFKKTLLSKIIVRSKEMLIYENCFKRGFHFYAISPLDSIQCVEYICSKYFGYNVLSPIVIQLEILSSIYVRLEAELKNTLKKQI